MGKWNPMKIGLISDTHGKIHPDVFEKFQKVDLILHAGDLDSEEILIELEALAPVYAVRGNMDHGLLASRLPETRLLEFEGVSLMLIHQGLWGNTPSLPVQEAMAKKKIDLVCFGHTHQPYWGQIQDTWFLNPGAAGKPRFHYPLGIALIILSKGKFDTEIISLPV
jgi:putative phosphoesterase